MVNKLKSVAKILVLLCQFMDAKFKIGKMNIKVIVCRRQFLWIDIVWDNQIKMFIFNLIDTIENK